MEFIIGSEYFFQGYPNYKTKDHDILVLLDNPLPVPVLNWKKDDEDIFLYSPLTKEEWIENTKTVPMKAGKFLIPEVCECIGFTLEDLKIFEDCFNNMDDKHKYEKIIYDAYLENKDFKLTDEQRNTAYKEYKKYR